MGRCRACAGGCVQCNPNNTGSQGVTVWTRQHCRACPAPPPSSSYTMISRHGAAACCWLLLSWLSFTNVFVAAQSTPESVVTPFSNLPSRLFFFDDSEVGLLYFAVEMEVVNFLSRSLFIMTRNTEISTCPLTKAEVGNRQTGYRMGSLP